MLLGIAKLGKSFHLIDCHPVTVSASSSAAEKGRCYLDPGKEWRELPAGDTTVFSALQHERYPSK
jgi:hypothetical protein